MLPSLRGTISGDGPPPPASVILKLMAENRESWDPAMRSEPVAAAAVATEPAHEDVDPAPDIPAIWVSGEEAATEQESLEAKPDVSRWAEVGRAERYVQGLARIAGAGQSPRAIKRAANLMAAIERGDVPAAPLIAAPPDFFRWVPVGSVLSRQPGWSGPRTRHVLGLLEIDSGDSLNALGEARRQALAKSLKTLDPAPR